MKGLSDDQQHDLFQHFCRSLKTIVQLSLPPRLIFCWLFLVQWQFLLFSSVLLVAPVSQLVTVLQAALPPTEQQEEKSELCRARTYSGHSITDVSWANAKHISTQHSKKPSICLYCELKCVLRRNTCTLALAEPGTVNESWSAEQWDLGRR